MDWHRQLVWKPGDLGWRVAALFMVGSFLFALGSVPLFSQTVDPGVVGVTFFVGSVFFTLAGYSQFLQVINDRGHQQAPPTFHLWAWQPDVMLWWATLIQFAGTLFFNMSTFDAMLKGLSTTETNHLVWAPDFFGSIAFLVASHIAWLFVCGQIWLVRKEDPDWWIAGLNYLGSIFFMLSAIGAFTLPTTGDIVNLTIVNLGTLVGAVCFFGGAYLLLPPTPAAAVA